MEISVARVRAFLAALVVFGIGQSAHASTITVTSPIAEPFVKGLVVNSRVEAGTIVEQSLNDTAIINASFAGFDPLLGTLKSVNLAATYQLSGFADAQVSSATAFPAKVSPIVDLSQFFKIGSIGGIFVSPTLVLGSRTFGCTAVSDACLTVNKAVVSGTFGQQFDSSTQDFLALFTNQFVVSFRLSALLTPTADPHATDYAMAFGTRNLDNIEYSLTYAYVPVPEPSTMMLVLLGGTAVAAGRRRHSKR